MDNTQIEGYSMYKDSGLRWLGNIPAHWNLIRGNYIFEIVNERSKHGEEELLSVSEHHGVRPRSVSNVSMFMAESYKGYKLCSSGDLVINSLWAWSRGLGISDYDGIVSTAYSVFRPDYTKYSKSYLNYLLRIEKYVAQYLIASKGIWISRLQLSDWSFLRTPILTPPLEEQTRIADFLDCKTAQIDTAIAQKERLIALLHERRQILIHNAVTRGLNPDVPMKDSGVEWIGEIPTHWKVVKLKYVTRFILDGTHGSYPRVEDGYRLLSVRNIIDDKFVFREDDSRVSQKHFNEISSKFLIKEKDLQLAIVGATLGKVAIVGKLEETFVTQRSVATIRVNEASCNHNFLFYYLKSPPFQSYLWLNAGYSAQPGVYLGTVQNSYVSLPHFEEQVEIVSFLNGLYDEFEKAIAKTQAQIEKLKEYKATLINSAVTGKIKV